MLFFKAVVHVVLLFGSETWVLTPRMEQAMSSFQHRVARHITKEVEYVCTIYCDATDSGPL